MSPMFLGGLTARAMKLQQQLQAQAIQCHEVYPAALVKMLPGLSDSYQKKSKNIEPFLEVFSTYLPLPFAQTPANWHQVDAALAWLSGHRFLLQQATLVGIPEEGIIIV